nr:aminotransferase class V-fold PLP-dependent enzyme [Anaerolineaceae bacterium]
MSDGGDFSNSFHNLKTDFPVLGRKIHNNFPLVYLDSAATSQKPTSVIETMADYYRKMNANIHRGVHT